MAESKAVSTVTEPHHFYLNITLLNKDEIIANKVQEKAGTGIFGKVAGKVANAGVSEGKIVNKLSEGLCQALPASLADMGIEGTFEEVFQSGSFVVFKCLIGAIDKLTLLRGAKGEEFAGHFQALLDAMAALGVEGAAANVDANIQSKVRLGMMDKLGSTIPTKMLEKGGLKVSCVVHGPATQADYFFQHLAGL